MANEAVDRFLAAYEREWRRIWLKGNQSVDRVCAADPLARSAYPFPKALTVEEAARWVDLPSIYLRFLERIGDARLDLPNEFDLSRNEHRTWREGLFVIGSHPLTERYFAFDHTVGNSDREILGVDEIGKPFGVVCPSFSVLLDAMVVFLSSAPAPGSRYSGAAVIRFLLEGSHVALPTVRRFWEPILADD